MRQTTAMKPEATLNQFQRRCARGYKMGRGRACETERETDRSLQPKRWPSAVCGAPHPPTQWTALAGLARHATTRGFTLPELLVTIAILGILLALAAPSLREILATSELRSLSIELTSTLEQARSEAIKRGGRVTVCPSANGTSCLTNVGDWRSGWIVFTDDTRTGTTASLDTGETVLRRFQGASSNIVTTGNLPYISFASDGTSRQLNGGFLDGTLQLCTTVPSIRDDERARLYTLNAMGRITVTKPSVSAACN